LLRALLRARGCSRPQYDSAKHIGWLVIDFAVEFDWDL